MILKTPVPDMNPRISPVPRVFPRPKSLMAGTGLAINAMIDVRGRVRQDASHEEIASDRFGRERRSKRAGQESACSARTLRTDLEKRRVRTSAVGPNVVYRETAIRLESGAKWNCQVSAQNVADDPYATSASDRPKSSKQSLV